MNIAGRPIGPDHPVFIVAEIGINHNGDPEIARRLIDEAADAGADAVKFQVGNPEKYVNKAEWPKPRETPWGVLCYIDYRRRLELPTPVLCALKEHAESRNLVWFASPLNPGAVDTLEDIDVPCYKIASPMVTDHELLRRVRATGKPVILSTGMSTIEEIGSAVMEVGTRNGLAILHCTSAYPCPPGLTNLRMIDTLRGFGVPVGYSGHETGVPASVAAVALGACIVERHVTLSRAMWGSDHAASLEPHGLRTLVRYIRTVEESLGDGVKRVYAEESANREKFRRLSA